MVAAVPSKTPIPIIDLFAGPGGLGEGFSSLRSTTGEQLFKIALSVEGDEFAHRTLELRAFYRQFEDGKRPKAYYDYVRGPNPKDRTALFTEFKDQADAARAEASQFTMSLDKAEELKSMAVKALGNPDRPWVLIGGPPCQAYSLAGRSRRAHDETFADDKKHTLYENYLRVIEDLKPAVFVMENVKGILSAKLGEQSTIERVLSDLRAAGSGYQVHSFVRSTDDPAALVPTDFIIKAEQYGIPQARHRVILLGVRSDLDQRPGQIQPFERSVPVRDVIGNLPALRSRVSKRHNTGIRDENEWIDAVDAAIPLIDDRAVAEVASKAAASARSSAARFGASFFRGAFAPKVHAWWYKRDAALNGVTNHNSRAHMASDLQRYLFCAAFAKIEKRSPVLSEFPEALLPAHANVAAGTLLAHFADRFRVQIAGRPSTTITSHIAKDGHYYIHYDPSQCRSLSVREAARLQTFPDDYFFEGNRTQQYHQVGNAVPPLLARQLAAVVADTLGLVPEPPLPDTLGQESSE